MKRLLFLIVPFTCFFVSETQAQCTPNASPCTNGAAVASFGGLCDTLIPNGMVGTPYSENIQFYIEGICFQTAEIGVSPDVNARITRLHDFSFLNMPGGVNGGTDAIEYIIPENAIVTGCGFFAGTPSEAGEFTCTINILGDARLCGFFPIDQNDNNVPYDITFLVLPDPSFTVPSTICLTDAAITLTADGTQGGTFSGPGVSGGMFDPAAAGLGTHTITYDVTAQEGAATGTATNSTTMDITVGIATTFYADTDNDGFGDAANTMMACAAPAGFVADNTDCDDTNAAINPNATEICDGIDNNCDGNTDEGLTFVTYYADTDNDGFGDAANSVSACSQPTGFVTDNTDCDDASAAVNPNATEICDGIDNNCDGNIDEGVQTAYYTDADNDGFGDMNATAVMACTAPAGTVTDNTDFDDTNANSYPGAPEVCDGEDNNNNGTTDEGVQTAYYTDADNDGFGDDNATAVMACTAPAGTVDNNTDCDDTNAGVNPNATEIAGNSIDEDCDGFDAIVDNDFDGFDNTVDCDDNNAAINPGATEICDGIDNNCDGNIDEGLLTAYYTDADNDGFGDMNATAVMACTAPAGTVTDNTDFDDSNANSYPGAPEVCDGADNNNDGNIDEGVLNSYYPDNDADGFGDANATAVMACTAPAGLITDNTDFDDTNNTLYPGAPELCDGLDNNNDGNIDEGVQTAYYPDADNDGFGDANATAVMACTQPAGTVTDNTDFDDTDNTLYPGAPELCDGLDNNNNGTIDEGVANTYYADTDNDGFGDAASSIMDCATTPPAGYVVDNTDCDDTNAQINPSAQEFCDGIDNNCDGNIDEGLPTTVFYLDNDADGFGVETDSIVVCNTNPPVGYATTNTDCNDNDDTVFPGATEIADDGIDQDCDPLTTSIRSLENTIDVKVFPNPTSGIVSIELQDNVELTIQVLDMKGSQVAAPVSTKGNGYTVDMTSLDAGVYSVKITTKDGGYAVKRIAKVN